MSGSKLFSLEDTLLFHLDSKTCGATTTSIAVTDKIITENRESQQGKFQATTFIIILINQCQWLKWTKPQAIINTICG